ncbi:MAG: TetR/AcrR family transcriptional regulator [Mucilaginibacter sp.]|jgi:AcrR family transcriptional regulator|uniref:TetR/AcrR family transcriptional regulator n=1 Tax=Mucilaginibacter sp. TaxID=1882438 RepID=UPI00356318D8
MDTKKNILDSAFKLFYHQGYNATGINQIIDEAGVSKPSLYQHFKSKEDLLIKYLEAAFNQTIYNFRFAASKKSGAKEKISAVFEYLAEYANSKEFNGCQFLNIAGEIPVENNGVYDVIRQQKNETRALFREILKSDSPGEDEIQRTESLADSIYLLFDGATMACKIFGSSWPAIEAHKSALKLL